MDYVPSPEEIAQMAAQMANMQRAFHRIQEISDAYHAEAQEHQKEMHRQYGSMNGDGNGYMHDSQHNGAVMAPDSKKRRGRAAPPGRCHSCNRAETPEWRRGPDGARTLCNACGLRKSTF
jgi:glutamate--cysteine ligase catalytic subunit